MKKILLLIIISLLILSILSVGCEFFIKEPEEEPYITCSKCENFELKTTIAKKCPIGYSEGIISCDECGTDKDCKDKYKNCFGECYEKKCYFTEILMPHQLPPEYPECIFECEEGYKIKNNECVPIPQIEYCDNPTYENWENICKEDEFKNNVFTYVNNFIDSDINKINIKCVKGRLCPHYPDCPQKINYCGYSAFGEWDKDNIHYMVSISKMAIQPDPTVDSSEIQIKDSNAKIISWDYTNIKELKELHNSQTVADVKNKIKTLTKINLDDTEELIGANYVALGNMMNNKFVPDIISFDTKERWYIVKDLYGQIYPKEPTMIASGVSNEILYYHSNYNIRSVFIKDLLYLYIKGGFSTKSEFTGDQYNADGIMEFRNAVNTCPACMLGCSEDKECNYRDDGDLRGLNYAGHNYCMNGRCYMISLESELGDKNTRPPVCGGTDNLPCTKYKCRVYCSIVNSQVVPGVCEKPCDNCWGICQETKESCDFANGLWINNRCIYETI